MQLLHCFAKILYEKCQSKVCLKDNHLNNLKLYFTLTHSLLFKLISPFGV
jgi:hypothetical protein